MFKSMIKEYHRRKCRENAPIYPSDRSIFYVFKREIQAQMEQAWFPKSQPDFNHVQQMSLESD